jgi:putative transposase
MSKKKTKQHKSKKLPELIRTDVWDLITLKSEKEQMLLTIEEYRKYLSPYINLLSIGFHTRPEITFTLS